MTRIFFEKIGPSLFFLAAGTTDTKVRRSTGVTTANSTNKYQKYKSVELGDQLPEKVINTELIKAQIFSEKEAKPGISNAENSVLHQQVVLCGLVSQAFSLHLNESIHAASVICLQVQCGYTSALGKAPKKNRFF